eukprot:11196524-Lingulodinium_polyedra.AAC.1
MPARPTAARRQPRRAPARRRSWRPRHRRSNGCCNGGLLLRFRQLLQRLVRPWTVAPQRHSRQRGVFRSNGRRGRNGA